MELSSTSTEVSATCVLRERSEKRVMVAFSFPSVRRSSLKTWLKEKVPLTLTVPDPLSSPLARSSSLTPLTAQKIGVPGLTLSVTTVVVSEPPSLIDVAEGESL